MADLRVELEPHVGKSLTNGKEVRLSQDRIRVNGKTVGLLPFKTLPDGKIEYGRVLLHDRFSPLELKEIENQVAFITGQFGVESRQAPERPANVNQQHEEEDFGNDFD